MRRCAKWYDIIKPLNPDMPVEPGEEWPSIATLWSCAKQMFTRITDFISIFGGRARLATRHLRRRERYDILDWLEPVEKTIRGCLIARAVDWLASEEGKQFLDRPSPAKPAQHSELSESTDAAPSDDTLPGKPATVQGEAPAADAPLIPAVFNASAWLRQESSPYVSHGVFEPGELAPEADAPAMPEKDDAPAATPLTPTSAKQRAPSGLRMARRIALLESLIANPDDAIRRLGRALARRPRDSLAPMAIGFVYTHVNWMQGIPMVRAARFRAIEALEAFAHVEPG